MLDKKIRDVLIAAFEHLQQQNSLIHDALTEVAAVRESLIELGPAYADVVDRHRSRLAGEAKPVAYDQAQKFDAIIQRLREPGNFV